MSYSTKQREILLEFFSKHPDTLYSVEDLARCLSDSKISISTIYRNITELEKAGKLRKSIMAGSHTAYYQYIDVLICREHLHLCCLKCGKTSHLTGRDSSKLADSIMQSENFNLDKKSTVLYGLCKNCAKEDNV